MGDQLERIGSIKGTRPLPMAQAMALSGYIRALSAVKRDRSPNRGGAGKYAGKSVEELRQLAMQDPELAEALGLLGVGSAGA